MTTSESVSALRQCASIVQARYRERVKNVFLVDARGLYDKELKADAEVVVVLANGDWRELEESLVLADLAYDALLEIGLYIRVTPVSEPSWQTPELAEEPWFLQDMKSRPEPIMVAA
jgi:hypothetical protein